MAHKDYWMVTLRYISEADVKAETIRMPDTEILRDGGQMVLNPEQHEAQRKMPSGIQVALEGVLNGDTNMGSGAWREVDGSHFGVWSALRVISEP